MHSIMVILGDLIFLWGTGALLFILLLIAIGFWGSRKR